MALDVVGGWMVVVKDVRGKKVEEKEEWGKQRRSTPRTDVRVGPGI